MVREMAEKIVRLEKRMTGKLWARSSTAGPQSIEELRVLLGRNGMWAAAWLLEGIPDLIEDAVDERTEEEANNLAEAEEEIKALEKKLSYIHQLTTGEESKDEQPKQPDDDIPF